MLGDKAISVVTYKGKPLIAVIPPMPNKSVWVEVGKTSESGIGPTINSSIGLN